MHQYGSLEVPQTPKSHNKLIEVFKFVRNKLSFCTYIESKTLKVYFEVCEPFRRSQPSVRRRTTQWSIKGKSNLHSVNLNQHIIAFSMAFVFTFLIVFLQFYLSMFQEYFSQMQVQIWNKTLSENFHQIWQAIFICTKQIQYAMCLLIQLKQLTKIGTSGTFFSETTTVLQTSLLYVIKG